MTGDRTTTRSSTGRTRLGGASGVTRLRAATTARKTRVRSPTTTAAITAPVRASCGRSEATVAEGIRTDIDDDTGNPRAHCPFGDYEITSSSYSGALQAVSFHMNQKHPGVEG